MGFPRAEEDRSPICTRLLELSLVPAPLTFASIKEALVPGSFLYKYVLWGMKQTDAPVAFHLACALSLGGAIAPPEMCVRPGRGVPIYAPMWHLIVAKSGIGRKSTCIRLQNQVLRAVEPNLMGHQPDSAEGMAESLAQQPTQLLSYSEFGELLAKSRAGTRLEGLRLLWTALYDCQPYQRRLSKSTTLIEHPRLSLLGGISEPYLARYTTDEDWTGGFFSRMCVWVAASEHIPPEEGATEAEFDDLVLHLKRVYGRKMVAPTGLSNDARKLLHLWADAKDRAAKAPETSEWLRGCFTRGQEQVCKAALINAMLEGRATDSSWTLEAEDIRVGIVVAEASINSVVWIVENLCASPYQRRRQEVINMLLKGPMSQPAIARRLKITKRELNHLLESVCMEGIVVRLPQNAHGVFHFTLRDIAEAVKMEDITDKAPTLDNVVPIKKANGA